jgi:hypothetical protein
MIAYYLPTQAIKNCRLVCRAWGREMHRCLAKRKLLIVTEEDCPEAKEILKNYKQEGSVCISNLCFFDVNTNSSVYKNLIAAFGYTLSGLKLEECQVTPNALALVLSKQSPYLESFSFKDRAPPTRQTSSTFVLIRQVLQDTYGSEEFSLPHLKRLIWDEEFGRVLLDEIIAVCPNLVELNLKNTPVPTVERFANLRWDCLTFLKFSPRDELREEYTIALASLKLRLRRLTLFGVNPRHTEQMDKLSEFLQSVASTIEELELFQHYSISSVVYMPQFLSPFPVNLPLLKRLYIDFALFRSWKTINSLPKLKSLDCKARSSQDWNEVLKLGLPEKHTSITHLNFGCVDNQVLETLHPCFPSLTNLELDAGKIDDTAFRTLIKGFPQLRQLKMSKIPLCEILTVTDSGITGISPEECEKLKGKSYDEGGTIAREFPSILDLKCKNKKKLAHLLFSY